MNLEEAIILSLQGKLEEARSHKEDNEKVAPRENTEKVFGELADTPKRDRLTGKNGWGYKDAQATEENEKGISKDIEKYKTLKSFAKDARASAEAYNDTARHWDEKASELVKSKKVKEEKLEERANFDKLDTVEYWAFCIGADLMHDEVFADGVGCDEAYEKAYELAEKFMNSEEFKDTSMSGYDALKVFLSNRGE